ncbi:mitochondrial import receptor subunit TOM20-like isoform X1 [Rutidosis leptorrhynchoides]|uniref:mitochondrial import receptor subunit TOM20-like isoform X1 n=1 Tax=Rutidosis leptorrhynchoides TaxID=125765 RepID=UPI003A9917F8
MSSTIHSDESLIEFQKDLDRFLIFEHARRNAEAEYLKNPTDADNLTRWGEALLKLAPFCNINRSKKFLRDAKSKLDEALTINPAKHEALWYLGKVHIANAFVTYDEDEAKIQFDLAKECFEKALKECPGNEEYQKNLDSLVTEAPEIRKKAHKQGGSGASSSAKAPEMRKEAHKHVGSAASLSMNSETVRCWCGRIAVITTSWTKKNLGRRFFGCPIEGSRCRFVGWYDPPMCERATMIIPGLLDSKNKSDAIAKTARREAAILKILLFFSWLGIAMYVARF